LANARLLLTPEELLAVSGYRRARDQVAWICEHYGIRAYVNAAGEAVVLRAHLEQAGTGAAGGGAPRVRIVREAEV